MIDIIVPLIMLFLFPLIIVSKFLIEDYLINKRSKLAENMTKVNGNLEEVVIIGDTKRCVCCLREIDEENHITPSSLVISGNVLILARFCNTKCLGDLYAKDPLWKGRYYDDKFGIKYNGSDVLKRFKK